ncbi:hypothetical protein HK099_002968, partial [Clydaea vesicula]
MNEEEKTKNKSKSKYISIGRASSITGLCQQTFRKLADTNKIANYKTPSGYRRYDVNYIME